jgi:hypothetical protein
MVLPKLLIRTVPRHLFVWLPSKTYYGGRDVTWWQWLWFTWSIQR